MRKNLYIEHKNFHRKTCVFTAPYAERGGGGGKFSHDPGTIICSFPARLEQWVVFCCFVFDKLWCKFTT